MYIAYIYDLSNNIIAQVDWLINLSITTSLNDVSTASFSLYHTNEYCTRSILKKYRRVKINKQVGNVESTMFDGVIRWFEANLTTLSVKLESFEHLLDRRFLHMDYVSVSQTVDSVLSTILDDINTLYDTGITLDCGITDLTSKEYKDWESFLKVLQDLASNGYEWIIEDKVLKFKSTVGVDLSTGDDFVEYRYNINEPEDRTIDDIKMVDDGKNFANGVIGKSWASFTEESDSASILENWLIEDSFSVSGDDATATASYLEDRKYWFAEYEVDGISKDFFEANLGDLVKVYIFVGNDLMYFNGTMKVIWKTFSAGDLEKIQFKLWKTKVKTKDIIEQIMDIQKRVKTLEFQ